MGRELQRLKLEQQRDERTRQLLREQAPEIRELETKLKAAYTNKERMAQVAEKEAHKFDEMVRINTCMSRCCIREYVLYTMECAMDKNLVGPTLSI